MKTMLHKKSFELFGYCVVPGCRCPRRRAVALERVKSNDPRAIRLLKACKMKSLVKKTKPIKKKSKKYKYIILPADPKNPTAIKTRKVANK